MTETELTIQFFIAPDQQGKYLTLPFTMPENVVEMRLGYHYQTMQDDTQTVPGGQFTSRERINIIDLGLITPDGKQAGASGSDKSNIFLSATKATPGYSPQPLTPGEWQILVGAYQVAPEGVTVTYEFSFTPKQRTLLLGDIHTHTNASDGVFTPEELAVHARRQGLDFLAITNHNQMISSIVLNEISGITLIPGVEWTHYQGHANFLGVNQPYDEPFFTNTEEEMKARFHSAHKRGALIVINHPCDDSCGFQFGLEDLPFDCLEIWNGPMRESNLRAVHLWQTLLESGKRIPVVGGSDYHRDSLFQILGGPCMGVYAMSNTPADILAALAAGNSYITFAPQGPTLEMVTDEAIMGDTASWHQDQTVRITGHGLKTGDVVRVIDGHESMDLFQAPGAGDIELTYPIPAPGFVRVEIQRTFLPGLPPLPALIANPIYFSESEK